MVASLAGVASGVACAPPDDTNEPDSGVCETVLEWAATLDAPVRTTVGVSATLEVRRLDGDGAPLPPDVQVTWSAEGAPSGVDAATPTTTLSWERPGRHQVLAEVTAPCAAPLRLSTTVSVTEAPVFTPRRSSSVAAVRPELAVVVSPDSDELVWVGLRRRAGTATDAADGFGAADGLDAAVVQRESVCRNPRTVTTFDGSAGGMGGGAGGGAAEEGAAEDGTAEGEGRAWVAVACPDDDTVVRFDEGADGVWREVLRWELPWGSRPFGVVATHDAQLFVTLQGPGTVARLDALTSDGVLTAAFASAGVGVVPDARGIAQLPDGRLAVTRWRSPDERGELWVLDPLALSDDALATAVPLAFDPQPASDTETGGVPSYLDVVAVSPAGDRLALPSTQANFGQGLFLNQDVLQHDFAVRAAVSEVALPGLEERFERRKLFDDRGLASAAVYSAAGDYLFVTMRGIGSVERLDVLRGGAPAGTLPDQGFAPQGLALAGDDLLLVDVYLSRELVVWSVDGFGPDAVALARVALVDEEPLDEPLWWGKVLFNDSRDLRLTAAGYMACAHCHLDGEADGRTWDFTDRGEGLRNTTSLLGRAGLGHGPLHWSGNFDEVQDFEIDIRLHFAGRGLLPESSWADPLVRDPLGSPKAGLSEDLDALAAYVASLDAWPRSPWREADGSLTPAAERGRAVFESAETGCVGCHAGPTLTDSAWLEPGVPLLHDVGTLGAGSGQRLGGALTGIDTPTLHELFNSAPYLHDGSAATLVEVLVDRNAEQRHGATAHLDEDQLEDLIIYLLSLDGRQD